MGTGDGTVLGVTKILDNGSDANRFNIVLVAEGFQNPEQGNFNNACSDFISAIQSEPWFTDFGGAINVHRLNVASDDSGADDPATCADGSVGSGTTVNTYFDATFCTSGMRRCLSGDTGLVRVTLDNNIPQWHVAAIIVNTIDGGCALGNICWTSFRTGWINTILHELGHAAFELGDEYDYWLGCDSGETDRNNAPPEEPLHPNVTTVTSRANLKWRHLVAPDVPIPTMQNPNCTQCDRRPNVLTDDHQIGLFEGAGYYHCGRYRPAYRCKMFSSSEPFCRVCVEAIADTLSNFKDCFIATAAFGSKLDPHVQFLREFRDEIVLESMFKTPFEWLLDLYYQVSPPIARKMEEIPFLREAVKYSIVYPFVFCAKGIAFLALALRRIKKLMT